MQAIHSYSFFVFVRVPIARSLSSGHRASRQKVALRFLPSSPSRRARLSICLESKVTDGLTDRWRRRMPLICLASSGASEIGGRVPWRMRGPRDGSETGIRAAVGRTREIKEDGKRVFGRRGLPVAPGLPLAAVNLLLLFFLSAFPLPPPLPPPLPLAPQGPLFPSSFSFITPNSQSREFSLFLRAFLPSFLYFPSDPSLSPAFVLSIPLTRLFLLYDLHLRRFSSTRIIFFQTKWAT